MKIEEILEKIIPVIIIGGVAIWLITKIKPGVGPTPEVKASIGEVRIE